MSDDDEKLKQLTDEWIETHRGPLKCTCGFTNAIPMTVLEHILFWDNSAEHSLAGDEANDDGEGVRSNA